MNCEYLRESTVDAHLILNIKLKQLLGLARCWLIFFKAVMNYFTAVVIIVTAQLMLLVWSGLV